MDNVKIVFNPSERNINEIETWSTEKTYLHQCYRSNNLVVAEYNNYTVGFYCLTELDEIIVKIETAETHSDFRRKGIARFIFNEIQKKYKNHYAFILDFSSSESKTYWENIGFSHSQNYVDSQNQMFKLIRPANEISIKDSSNTIEIIDDFGKSFKWNFQLKENINELISPIVFFGFIEWKMILTLNNKIVFNEEYKYFDDDNDITSYIFIKSIPYRYI